MKLKYVALVALLSGLAGPVAFATAPANAGESCEQKDVCVAPPHITYNGTENVVPTLLPTVCLTQQAIDLMTVPGNGFWFTYYQRYQNNGVEDMTRVIRTECITHQWVVSGTRIGFWVDCDGERWWFETTPITTSGTYQMNFLRKEPI